MLAHELPFGCGEAVGLVEHGVGDRDLADVVEQRGGGDDLDLALVDPELPRDGARHLDDRLGVLAGVAIALQQRVRRAPR